MLRGLDSLPKNNYSGFLFCRDYHELAVVEAEIHHSHGIEIDYYAFGCTARYGGLVHDKVHIDWLGGPSDQIQYASLCRAECQGYRAVATELAPGAYHEWGCEYVLVGHTPVGFPASIGVECLHRLVGAGIYFRTYHYCSILGGESRESELLRRAAVHLCRLFYHVDVLFVADSGYRSVVLDPDQQSPSFMIGEGRQALGYLFCVGDGELEILAFVLAFSYDPGEIEFSAYRFDVFHRWDMLCLLLLISRDS